MNPLLLLLGIGGAIVLYYFMRNDELAVNRYAWRNSGIHSYRITLRYDRRSLNLDGEILGDATTITVVDGVIADVLGPYVADSSIDEYERFTVDGLFEQVIYYQSVQYDSVYGFPTRLGDTNHWVIEVIDFEILD